MNRLQKILVVIFASMVFVLIGCSAWMEGITPAYIDSDAITYSGEKPTIFTPWTSLWDLRRMDRALDHMHYRNQKEIARELQDDQDQYKYLKDAMQINMMSAEQLRDTLFSPEGGLISLILAGSGFGLGSMLLSKPGDKKRIAELESQIAQNGTVTNGSQNV